MTRIIASKKGQIEPFSQNFNECYNTELFNYNSDKELKKHPFKEFTARTTWSRVRFRACKDRNPYDHTFLQRIEKYVAHSFVREKALDYFFQ